MSDSNTLSGSAQSAAHSVPELEQIAAAERELKRRGRRRLIGAGTLGLLGVIFLPMFFDTEPRGDKKPNGNSGNSKEITITIPQREGFSPLPPPAAALNAPSTSNSLAKSVEQAAVAKVETKAETAEPKISGTAVALGAAAVGAAVAGAAAVANSSAANDKNAAKPEVVQSKPAVVSVAPPTAKIVSPPAVASAPGPAPAPKPAQVAVAKPEVKPEAKPAVKPETKPVLAPVVAPSAVVPPAPQAPLAPAGLATPTAGGFVVQLGAFSDDYNIRTLTDRMKAGKLPVYAEKIQITSAGKPKTVTRLRVGPYPTMEKAKLISAKVKALGVTNTVVAK